MQSPDRIPVVVLGAGPAGLAAAWKLARRNCFDVTVLERGERVGGNAASFELDGIRVDYGSHRLHRACPEHVLSDIRSMLGVDLLDRKRDGRILLRDRWVKFPLNPLDLLLNLPPSFIVGFIADALLPRRRAAGEPTFASELESGLGKTICRDFYFPYAKKIWGVAPGDLDAEQARRRVSANSVWRLVAKVLKSAAGAHKGGSNFYYPRQGYGQISDAYHRAAVEAGVRVELGATASAIETDNGRAVGVVATGEQGSRRFPARLVLSTIPLPALARAMQTPPTQPVRASLDALEYRAMVLVYLVLDTDRFTQYDAHYFPGPEVAITRLSEPKNYSLGNAPGTTVLCAELPCSVGDGHWEASDGELGALVVDALANAGLPKVSLRRVVARRLAHAYPIYTRGYQEHFERLDRWIGEFAGLLSFGRQGLFVHDNTHHTLAMAYAAGECIDDAGGLATDRWGEYREAFESHVVED